MFPDTFQAALVTALLVLPGALYASRRMGSYGARHPSSEDLYLAQTFACDERTGTLIEHDGRLVLLDEGLLIRWEEIRYLYFTPMRG